VLKAQGVSLPDEVLLQSTALTLAFSDPAATAKALADATKAMTFVKVKAGMMAGQVLSAAQVKSLAELPPLPVVRAQLLGVLQAPAGKLVRTISEPARALAAVVRAYSEKVQAAA
jgi:large subunit ribosomal protein L10